MIVRMVRRNCLIGLNYCKSFITDGGIGDSPDDPLPPSRALFSASVPMKTSPSAPTSTVRHFLHTWNTPAKAADLYEYFLEKGMSKDLAEGIMFRNAEEFFRKNL